MAFGSGQAGLLHLAYLTLQAEARYSEFVPFHMSGAEGTGEFAENSC